MKKSIEDKVKKSYMDYLAERLDKSIDFSMYVTGDMDSKHIDYATYVAESLDNQYVEYGSYSNEPINYADYICKENKIISRRKSFLNNLNNG